MIKSRSLTFHSSPRKTIPCSGSIDEIKDFIHRSNTSFWEPPWASWRCRLGLPYGWEQALDSDGNCYYIDHLTRSTTYEDPRQSQAPQGTRTVTINRSPEIGFGFVAAGQEPTVIQFVSPEGPSDGLLYANDQILEVNGVDMRQVSKDEVVNAVRAARDQLRITVLQIPQKTKNKKNHKVRFTDRVLVSSLSGSKREEFPPPALPNVVRIYLENGQTRSFKFNDATTCSDLEKLIMDKLHLSARSHFCLAMEYSLGAKSSRISLLRSNTTIKSIMAMPNSEHLKCVFRFAFIPSDAFTLFSEDPKALEYYYQQCVNDVVKGRYAYEMRYEACVRLAALHIQQIAFDCNVLKDGKVSVNKVEKEYGLHVFLPPIVLENVKKREIRKHLRFYLKRDSTRSMPCISNSKCSEEEPSTASSATSEPSSMARIKYIHIVSHLPSFGGRAFSVTFKESQIDMIMQVEPRSGLLVRHPGRTGQPSISIGFDLIGKLVVTRDTEVASMISIRLASNPQQGLEFLMDKDDIDDLVMYIVGYHKVIYSTDLEVEVDDTPPRVKKIPETPPPYAATHKVVPSTWNYSDDVSMTEKSVDFSDGPPSYQIASAFVSNFKKKPLMEETEDASTSTSVEITQPKKLLKATDSLLIKRDGGRPPQRPQDLDTISDSSDTENSSFSSPLRSPKLGTINDSSLENIVTDEYLKADVRNIRRESIETLIQNNNSNLEALILQFEDNGILEEEGSRTPQNGTAKKILNGRLSNSTTCRAFSPSDLTPINGSALISDGIKAIDDDIPLI